MDFFRGKLALLQVLFHQFLVILSDHLHKLFSFLGRFFFQRRRDVLFFELSALVLLEHKGLHPNKVYDSYEVLLFAQRKLKGHDLPAEEFPDRIQRSREPGIFPVQLVDNDQAGKAVLLEHLPDLFGADLDAGDAVNEYSCARPRLSMTPSYPKGNCCSRGCQRN